MNLGYLARAFARVISSLLSAGIFYSAWLTAFLLIVGLENPVLEAIAWLSAPVATAAGFATGIAIFERLTGASRSRFLHIFAWPLIGCVIGAGAVYWFGPMLIVFGMFAAGTMSVVLREARDAWLRKRSQT